jgi:hypothetical protein
MKYFLPLDRNRPAWVARIRALESPGEREDNPTVVAMSGYLLALDDLCDQLGQRMRSSSSVLKRLKPVGEKRGLCLLKPKPKPPTRKVELS